MQKVVLVTGASTGIGFDTVRVLIENNFSVVATVRKDADRAALEKLYGNKIKVLILDVLDRSAVEVLPLNLQKLGIKEVFGLVNNAGVALAAPFAHQDFSEIESILQINVLSVMKITQVLLPMMMPAQGRVVNLSSVSGRSAAPFLSIYAASKHAIEGFSEALRKELMLHNMKVVVVAPGSIKTPIWQKGFVIIREKYAHTPYAKSFELFVKFAMSEEKHALEVTEVSNCILHALTSEEPKFRYAPIPRKWINWYLPKIIPAKIYNNLTAKALLLKK